jgi:uncharacterized membrane protein
MTTRVLWFIMAVLAILIGLYPGIYFLVDRTFGLLSTKSDALLVHPVWNIGFYAHIVPGGIALLTGWSQFHRKFRQKRPDWHRLLGKIYVSAVMVSSLAGIGIAFYATGGWVSTLGFGLLGIIWFVSTLRAYQHARNQRFEAHATAMLYSYAACFAAVTLRIWLPLLTALTGDFFVAYPVVAWLSWVPNLAWAYWVVQRRQRVEVR